MTPLRMAVPPIMGSVHSISEYDLMKPSMPLLDSTSDAMYSDSGNLPDGAMPSSIRWASSWTSVPYFLPLWQTSSGSSAIPPMPSSVSMSMMPWTPMVGVLLRYPPISGGSIRPCSSARSSISAGGMVWNPPFGRSIMKYEGLGPQMMVSYCFALDIATNMSLRSSSYLVGLAMRTSLVLQDLQIFE